MNSPQEKYLPTLIELGDMTAVTVWLSRNLSLRSSKKSPPDIKAHIKNQVTQGIYLATLGGQIKMVEALLPYGDPKYNNSIALRAAAERGHLELVCILMPVSDPCEDHETNALSLAATQGHLEVVKALIPFINPRSKDSYALARAALHGHLEIVKFLLPLSDPRANRSIALFWAVMNDRDAIVDTLIPVSDVDAVFHELNKEKVFDTTAEQYCKKIRLLIPHVSLDVLKELPSGIIERLPMARARLLSTHLMDTLAPEVSPSVPRVRL